MHHLPILGIAPEMLGCTTAHLTTELGLSLVHFRFSSWASSFWLDLIQNGLNLDAPQKIWWKKCQKLYHLFLASAMRAYFPIFLAKCLKCLLIVIV